MLKDRRGMGQKAVEILQMTRRDKPRRHLSRQVDLAEIVIGQRPELRTPGCVQRTDPGMAWLRYF